MKTASDPRHQRRRKLVRQLYSYGFSPSQATKEIKPIINNLENIDRILAKAAPEWPIEKLNKIDLAILRLAMWELLIQKNIPPKVVIDEAVELGKEFGAESSPGFINGVLGTVLSSFAEDHGHETVNECLSSASVDFPTTAGSRICGDAPPKEEKIPRASARGASSGQKPGVTRESNTRC